MKFSAAMNLRKIDTFEGYYLQFEADTDFTTTSYLEFLNYLIFRTGHPLLLHGAVPRMDSSISLAENAKYIIAWLRWSCIVNCTSGWNKAGFQINLFQVLYGTNDLLSRYPWPVKQENVENTYALFREKVYGLAADVRLFKGFNTDMVTPEDIDEMREYYKLPESPTELMNEMGIEIGDKNED